MQGPRRKMARHVSTEPSRSRHRNRCSSPRHARAPQPMCRGRIPRHRDHSASPRPGTVPSFPLSGGRWPPPPHRRPPWPGRLYARNASSPASSTSRSPPPRSVAVIVPSLASKIRARCPCFSISMFPLQAPVVYSPAYDISFLGLEKL